MRYKLMAAGVAAVVFFAALAADRDGQPAEKGQGDGILDQLRQESAVPGLAAAVLVRGREPRLFVSGVANTRSGAPVTTRTLFHYYSVTKLFTAVAILQLIERGQVRLDADVRDYLPEIVLRAGFDRDAGALTIEHLLSHRSGFGRETDSLGFHFPGEPALSTQQLLQRLLRHELKYRPGTDSGYSNINFALLAAVLERVSGLSFEAYLRSRVLEPLGMHDTDFHYRASARDVASGYVGAWSLMHWMILYLVPSQRRDALIAHSSGLFGERELNRFELDAKGYGGMIGSIEDLGKFLAFQLDSSNTSYDAILGRDFRRMALERVHGSYALAWAAGCAGPGTFGHVGGGPGFKATVCVSPQKGWGMAVLSNKFTSGPSVGAMLRRLGLTG